MNEPVADAARAILDGHFVLSRELAHRNHYPAIDVLQSVSRLAGDLLDPEVLAAAGALRESLAVYRDNEDLITIGAYQLGADARVDAAIELRPALDELPAPGHRRARPRGGLGPRAARADGAGRSRSSPTEPGKRSGSRRRTPITSSNVPKRSA